MIQSYLIVCEKIIESNKKYHIWYHHSVWHGTAMDWDDGNAMALLPHHCHGTAMPWQCDGNAMALGNLKLAPYCKFLRDRTLNRTKIFLSRLFICLSTSHWMLCCLEDACTDLLDDCLILADACTYLLETYSCFLIGLNAKKPSRRTLVSRSSPSCRNSVLSLRCF